MQSDKERWCAQCAAAKGQAAEVQIFLCADFSNIKNLISATSVMLVYTSLSSAATFTVFFHPVV